MILMISKVNYISVSFVKKNHVERVVDSLKVNFLCTHTCNAASRSEKFRTSRKHLKVQEVADKHYLRNAKEMEQYSKYLKPCHKFTVGDRVTVQIPKVDRASTDLHRLPCVIIKVVWKKKTH